MTVTELSGRPEPRATTSDSWLDWLAEHTDPAWRPGEWDQSSWMLTSDPDNPRTRLKRCRTPSCPGLGYNGRCPHCYRLKRASGLDDAAFTASYDPSARRRKRWPTRCSFARDGAQCESDASARGMCSNHYNQFDRLVKRGVENPLATMAQRSTPFKHRGCCDIAACPWERWATTVGLCHNHFREWQQHLGDGGDDSMKALRDWKKTHQRAWGGLGSVDLGTLAVPFRHELLYCLQCRDKHCLLDTGLIRIVLARLTGVETLVEFDDRSLIDSGVFGTNENAKGMLRDLTRCIRIARLEFTKTDPTAVPVWDLQLVGVKVDYNRVPITRGELDFGTIRVTWLREIALEWARCTTPKSIYLRQAVRVCTLASDALRVRPHSGEDPAALALRDMTAIVNHIKSSRGRGGRALAESTQSGLLTAWWNIVSFGRSSGLMEQVPGTFCRTRNHNVKPVDENEDEEGKAIPESVIAQLDRHLDLLSPDMFGGRYWPPDDLAVMYRLAYKILRDTGRRPTEVMTLRKGCVERDQGGRWQVIFDNHKSRRHRRRLPIPQELAQDIMAWEGRLADLPVPEDATMWLFPRVTNQRANQTHLRSGRLAEAIRVWVAKIPDLHGELVGPDGRPLPFDCSEIVPRNFRHSYAQRHADAGIDIDVLRKLMDHKSAETTGRYYRVSLKRKHEAAATMNQYCIDRFGRPAPFDNELAYDVGSVAVPFGNCTEPSNVRAGGHACPIRFQCAGCAFYRPDPSYLPAVEAHIIALRADRAAAEAAGSALFVIENLTSQIDAFMVVTQHMRATLESMSEEERCEVEDASRLLRRTRALKRIPLQVVGGET